MENSRQQNARLQHILHFFQIIGLYHFEGPKRCFEMLKITQYLKLFKPLLFENFETVQIIYNGVFGGVVTILPADTESRVKGEARQEVISMTYDGLCRTYTIENSTDFCRGLLLAHW